MTRYLFSRYRGKHLIIADKEGGDLSYRYPAKHYPQLQFLIHKEIPACWRVSLLRTYSKSWEDCNRQTVKYKTNKRGKSVWSEWSKYQIYFNHLLELIGFEMAQQVRNFHYFWKSDVICTILYYLWWCWAFFNIYLDITEIRTLIQISLMHTQSRTAIFTWNNHF